ncbi:MAG: tRNA (adenosine(37)-N6)-threonylcarbamoyltransferase complex ATPase subunit type 1 TsaE [Pedobacter sp.]|nr:MAG: tRNA (adenosine(37)-N6)-threonylcarbamoyltransferase complex ATPase subunit type 1 TsaE [Pedobacter sp.]
MQTIEITKLDELTHVATAILKAAGPLKFFIFRGGMGAGKTTLIKEITKLIGSSDLVNSPTFSIVNEYHSPLGNLYHFDFYRLKSITEAYDIGYEEYFYSDHYCFVEWPEKVEELLPDDYVEVHIKIEGDNIRKFEFGNIES